MSELAVRDFTREPSAYIERVTRGETFKLTRYGKVVARLMPPPEVQIAREIELAERNNPRMLDAGPPVAAGRGKTSSAWADRNPKQAATDAILGQSRGRSR